MRPLIALHEDHRVAVPQLLRPWRTHRHLSRLAVPKSAKTHRYYLVNQTVLEIKLINIIIFCVRIKALYYNLIANLREF